MEIYLFYQEEMVNFDQQALKQEKGKKKPHSLSLYKENIAIRFYELAYNRFLHEQKNISHFGKNP